MKNIVSGWHTHKKIVITGAQIITILTLVLGMIGNHYSNAGNTDAITSSNQWMKDAIKSDRITIQSLQVENAILKTKFDELKERVDLDEFMYRLDRESKLNP
jgi:hypothetical protein